MKRVATILFAVACAVSVLHAAPEKIGEDIFKVFETPHPYAAEGEAVRTDVVTFLGATYIAPHFSRFNLAEGDYVVVRSPDGQQSWKYEGLGRAGLGESAGGFWAIHIKGEVAIVELHASQGGNYGYTIDRFARGYRVEETTPLGPEATCGADDTNWAKCYQISEPAIYDKSRAVARLLINGSGGCTGWLVGNAGHLMTNNHCILNAGDAANTDYEFMAEGATCATNCASFGGCPGTIEAASATFVQTDVNLDFTLVQLPTNITPTYGFLRLRQTLPAIDERVYLPGHPGAWGKRFAVASTHPGNPSGFCEVDTHNEPVCAGGAVPEIGYWCDTEGGSSGSPVIAYSDHKVVSLHHCNQGAGCSGGPNRGLRIPNIISTLGANLPPGSVFDPVGRVTLDRNRYSCSSVVGIEVRDDSIIGAGSQNVAIHSTSEPLDETVVLTETPASSGIFIGSIAATTAAAANGDGLLTVANGDTITVTYIDADDGAGGVNLPRTDTAAVDCVAPVITNVHAINVTGNSADILWDTNESADSLATYGLAASPPPTSTASSATLVTSHSVHVTGLLPCRSHIYKVASRDEAGNSAENDNGGSYYAFTTGANTTPTYASTSVPVSIPDNAPAGASATISVSDTNTIQDVNVKVKITHSYDGDLVLSMTGPGGQQVVLSNRRGAGGDNFNDTVFDDAAGTSITTGAPPYAGSFRPEQPLSVYNGLSPAGTWTLKVVDAAGADTGTIDTFELNLTYPPQPCGPYVRRVSHSLTEVCNGTGSGSGDTVVDPGEDLTLTIEMANTGSDTATSVTGNLATTTSGVTITQGGSSYGDLDPAESSVGNSNYTVHVADTVPCGTLIDFQITATASQGTYPDAFTVRVGVPALSTTTYNSTDVPKTIADSATVDSLVSVSDPSTVNDVNVTIGSITHSYDGDLDIFLIGPNAVSIDLTSDNGGTGENFSGTVFDDSAATSITAGVPPYSGSFIPEAPLAGLNGVVANGTWTLRITDDAGGDTGTLSAWSVTLTTGSGYSCNVCSGSVAPPGEVVSLSFSSVGTANWTAAAGATSYNLYRGIGSDLPKLLNGTDDSCNRMSTASLSASGLSEIPPALELWWWLVRAANPGGEGPAGGGSMGPWVQNSYGACP